MPFNYLTTGLGDLSYLDSPDTGTAWREHDATGAQAARETIEGMGSLWITRDALGRPLTTTFNDPTLTITLTYDVADTRCPAAERYPIGRRATMTDSSGHTAYCYDAAGRITRKIQTVGGHDLTVAYRYTRAGRLAGTTLPDGSTVGWRHDAYGQVSGVDVAPAGAGTTPLLTAVTWHALGGATGWTYGNGRRLARRYDANGRPLEVTDMAPGGLRHTLHYDEVGHLARLDTGTVSRTYRYDGLGRLTETRDADTNRALHQYTYDATGNRTSLTVGGTTDRYVYATDSHHLTTAEGQLRRYDSAGNTIAIGPLETFHNFSGQVASIRQTSTTLASYLYNGDGQRITRTEGGVTTHTVYDEAGHWLGDYDASGRAMTQAIWLNDYPVGLIVEGRVLYIEPDHLGTPRAVIDPARNVAVWQWKLEGEAFGADLPEEDPDADGTLFTLELRFPGQRYDAVSGLHYNYHRYFDPASGRYIQSDPIGLAGGISTYAYVGSNPYTKMDPLGLWSFSFEAYLGFGGGITFGRDPRSNEWFYGGRLGVGISVGGSLDPKGARPGADGLDCSHGTTLGVFAQGSYTAGVVGGNFFQAAAGIQLDNSGKEYFDPPGPSRHLQLNRYGIGLGYSVGIEVIGH